ncbi:MAG: hypothetical protein K2X27_21480 [Candidatus Obscuribacterales bacterium]|nr:hypothetical protein [Candidatus Obscuribacterales bacterium]
MLSKIKKQLQHQEITLFMFFLALCLFRFPLQHHISLARFQHYGLALYVWALGFFFQLAWSWKKLSLRGRACLLSTGTYIGFFAMVFYQNPWLDARMAVQTEGQDLLRLFFAAACVFFGFIVSVIWLAWVLEKNDKNGEKGS